ncbi:BRO-N domain-containing protein [Pseudomonas sp. Q1-7]|uniref:BRO-N domain-containing protein n=1 Tax=Pseudomonas sp. Q1-7 TaxID=3020843 RepID=UPI0023019BE3|nr:BRO family protein [Pseudomonas sp. Q1-7]
MPELPPLHPTCEQDPEVLMPSLFVRHKRQLRAVVLDDEPWFAASDLARLIHHPLMPERVQRNLDDDQLQHAWMRNGHGEYQEEMLISESGVYAVLILYYHPENRSIREWITQQVVPRLRHQARIGTQLPYRALLQWRDRELEVLQWRGTTWVQLRDCPQLLPVPPHVIG